MNVAQMSAMAGGLIRKFSELLTFTRTVGSTFTPSTGNTNQTVINYYLHGVPVPNTSEKEITNETTIVDDLQIYVELGSVTPIVGDRVVALGKTYRILAITQYPLQGQSIVYKVQARI